ARLCPRHAAARSDDADLPSQLGLVELNAELVRRLMDVGAALTLHVERPPLFRRSLSESMYIRISPNTESGSMMKDGSIPAIFSNAFSSTLPADSAVSSASASTAV